MWSDYECSLKVKSTGFTDGLKVGGEKKNEVKITLKFFVASIMGKL